MLRLLRRARSSFRSFRRSTNCIAGGVRSEDCNSDDAIQDPISSSYHSAEPASDANLDLYDDGLDDGFSDDESPGTVLDSFRYIYQYSPLPSEAAKIIEEERGGYYRRALKGDVRGIKGEIEELAAGRSILQATKVPAVRTEQMKKDKVTWADHLATKEAYKRKRIPLWDASPKKVALRLRRYNDFQLHKNKIAEDAAHDDAPKRILDVSKQDASSAYLIALAAYFKNNNGVWPPADEVRGRMTVPNKVVDEKCNDRRSMYNLQASTYIRSEFISRRLHVYNPARVLAIDSEQAGLFAGYGVDISSRAMTVHSVFNRRLIKKKGLIKDDDTEAPGYNTPDEVLAEQVRENWEADHNECLIVYDLSNVLGIEEGVYPINAKKLALNVEAMHYINQEKAKMGYDTPTSLYILDHDYERIYRVFPEAIKENVRIDDNGKVDPENGFEEGFIELINSAIQYVRDKHGGRHGGYGHGNRQCPQNIGAAR